MTCIKLKQSGGNNLGINHKFIMPPSCISPEHELKSRAMFGEIVEMYCFEKSNTHNLSHADHVNEYGIILTLLALFG